MSDVDADATVPDRRGGPDPRTVRRDGGPDAAPAAVRTRTFTGEISHFYDMTDATPGDVTDETRAALERLYDDPDEEIAELLSCRADDGAIREVHRVFRALANENRLRLLGALRHGERCVRELVAVLDAPQSTVATHLRTLRDAGLVKRRRKGRRSYYRIADAGVVDLVDLARSVREG